MIPMYKSSSKRNRIRPMSALPTSAYDVDDYTYRNPPVRADLTSLNATDAARDIVDRNKMSKNKIEGNERPFVDRTLKKVLYASDNESSSVSSSVCRESWKREYAKHNNYNNNRADVASSGMHDNFHNKGSIRGNNFNRSSPTSTAANIGGSRDDTNNKSTASTDPFVGITEEEPGYFGTDFVVDGAIYEEELRLIQRALSYESTRVYPDEEATQDLDSIVDDDGADYYYKEQEEVQELRDSGANSTVVTSETNARSKGNNSSPRRKRNSDDKDHAPIVKDDTLVIVGSETNDCAKFTHNYLILAYASTKLAQHLKRIPPNASRYHDHTDDDDDVNCATYKKKNTKKSQQHSNCDIRYRLRIPHKPAKEWKLLHPFLEPHTSVPAEVTIENLPMLLPWFFELNVTVQLQSCDELLLYIVASPVTIIQNNKSTNINQKTMSLQDQLLLSSSSNIGLEDPSIHEEGDQEEVEAYTEAEGNHNDNQQAPLLVNILSTDEDRKRERRDAEAERKNQNLELQTQALLDLLYLTRIACKANLLQTKQRSLSALSYSLMEQQLVWLHAPQLPSPQLTLSCCTNKDGDDDSSDDEDNHHDDSNKGMTTRSCKSPQLATRTGKATECTTPISRFEGIAGILLDCVLQEEPEADKINPNKVSGPVDCNNSRKSNISTNDDHSDESSEDEVLHSADVFGRSNKTASLFDTVEAERLFQSVIMYLPPDLTQLFVHRTAYFDTEDVLVDSVRKLLENPLFPYLLRQGMISHNVHQQRAQEHQKAQQFFVSNPGDGINKGTRSRACSDSPTGNGLLCASSPIVNYKPGEEPSIALANAGHHQMQKVANELQASFSAVWKLSTCGIDMNGAFNHYKEVANDIWDHTNQSKIAALSPDHTITTTEQRREWLQHIWRKMNDPPLFCVEDEKKNGRQERQQQKTHSVAFTLPDDDQDQSTLNYSHSSRKDP